MTAHDDQIRALLASSEQSLNTSDAAASEWINPILIGTADGVFRE